MMNNEPWNMNIMNLIDIVLLHACSEMHAVLAACSR
jgi:hypothetical protein